MSEYQSFLKMKRFTRLAEFKHSVFLFFNTFISGDPDSALPFLLAEGVPLVEPIPTSGVWDSAGDSDELEIWPCV